jgi:hypothetical protein
VLNSCCPAFCEEDSGADTFSARVVQRVIGAGFKNGAAAADFLRGCVTGVALLSGFGLI